MKNFITLIATSIFASLSLLLVANDCSTSIQIVPTVLAANSQQSGSLASAGFSGVGQCAGQGSNADMWYRFQAAASRMYIAAQGNGDLDIAIELFDACGGTLITCRNNTGAGALEVANVPNLTVGQTYYLRVFSAGDPEPDTQTFEVSAFHIPYVELRSQDCNVFNYNTNQIIRSTQPPLSQFTLTNYQWRFEELEPPFNTYEVISPNGTNPNYRLEWFAPIQYGRTYEVSVRIRISEGGHFGDWGNTCTIGFQPTVLTTRLQQQFSGGFFNFCNVVGADKVGAASKYRWNFNDLSVAVNVFGDGDSRLLKLQNVPGLKLGQTYIVSVFAEVNGDESPAGTLRFLNMNNFVPSTGLRQDLYPCGQTYALNATVQAVEVCSAESYTWRFTNTSQAQADLIYTRSDGSRFLKLDWVPGLIVGDSYNVAVLATQGSLEGLYSTICNIHIGPFSGGGGPSSLTMYNTDEIEELNTSNQYSTEAHIQQGTDGTVSVLYQGVESGKLLTLELYTASGQMVARKVTPVNQGEQFLWNTGTAAAGIYILRTTDGTHATSHKLAFF